MKKLLLLTGLFSLIAMMSFVFADFYSSMTKVDYNEGSKTLKFTTKMNTNHIADALKINPNTAGFEAEVKKYVNNNFSVTINGASKNLTFTGSQVNGESVWVYFETSGVTSLESIKIRNSILISQFPKQINILNINYKGSQKTMNFMKGKESQEASF